MVKRIHSLFFGVLLGSIDSSKQLREYFSSRHSRMYIKKHDKTRCTCFNTLVDTAHCFTASTSTHRLESAWCLAQSSNSNFVFTLNTIDPLEIQANKHTHLMLNIFYFLWSLWPEKLIVIERITVLQHSDAVGVQVLLQVTIARNNSFRPQWVRQGINKQL